MTEIGMRFSVKPWQRYGAVLLAGVLLGAGGVWWLSRPAQVVLTPNQPTVVQRPDIRPQDVAGLVPTAIQPVTAHRQRGGKVMAVARATSEIAVQPSDTPQRVPVEAVAVVSETKRGELIASLDLFTVRDGLRVPIPAQTTVVLAQPRKPRWHVTAAVQGGLGWTGDTGAVVGLHWLRRGQGHAEDSTIALLSPAVVITAERVIPALLPVSLNVGRVLPVLSDVWLSPVLTYDGRIGAGLAVSATF